jgi:hypothetical protein
MSGDFEFVPADPGGLNGIRSLCSSERKMVTSQLVRWQATQDKVFGWMVETFGLQSNPFVGFGAYEWCALENALHFGFCGRGRIKKD